jgi:hypothetical protein
MIGYNELRTKKNYFDSIMAIMRLWKSFFASPSHPYFSPAMYAMCHYKVLKLSEKFVGKLVFFDFYYLLILFFASKMVVEKKFWAFDVTFEIQEKAEAAWEGKQGRDCLRWEERQRLLEMGNETEFA